MVLINSIMLGNMIKGYLGSKALNKISGIKNRIASFFFFFFSSFIHNRLDNIQVNGHSKKPEANLLFGARSLSELKLRESIAKQSLPGAISENTSACNR